MALNFAKKSLKLENFSKLLPLNESKRVMNMNRRNPERFAVYQSRFERHRVSAVPFLQRLLNEVLKSKERSF